MTAPDLVLRDVHAPVAPPLWPPAPGWWLVAALLLVVVGGVAWWMRARRRRRRTLDALFEDTLADAATPTERVAALSGLLRRAARLHDAAATHLDGERWLDWLDAHAGVPGIGHRHAELLLEGGWRRDLPAHAVDALEADAHRAWRHLVFDRGAWTRARRWLPAWHRGNPASRAGTPVADGEASR